MSVTPYLQVTDAKKAIDFYVEAFGAVEQFRLPAEDGKKIMHAVLAIAGGTVFLSDMAPPAIASTACMIFFPSSAGKRNCSTAPNAST